MADVPGIKPSASVKKTARIRPDTKIPDFKKEIDVYTFYSRKRPPPFLSLHPFFCLLLEWVHLKAIIMFLFHHCTPPPSPPGLRDIPAQFSSRRSDVQQPSARACTHERARPDGRACQSDLQSWARCSQPSVPASVSTGSAARGLRLSASHALAVTPTNPACSHHNIQSCGLVSPGTGDGSRDATQP